MARLLFVLIAVAVTFMVYSLVDTILRPARFIRALPKWAWVLIVIFIPILGGVLWFLIGRGRRSDAPMNRMTAPDDDPEFLRGLSGNGSSRSTFAMPSPASTDENIRDLEKRFADFDFDGTEGSASGGSASGRSASGKSPSGKSSSGKSTSGKSTSGEPLSEESVSGDDDSNTGRNDRKPGPAA